MGDKKTPSASLNTALTPEQLMSAMTMYGHAAVSAVPSKEKTFLRQVLSYRQGGIGSMTKPRCVILGASPDANISDWSSCLRQDDYLVCADGGYLLAQQAGVLPQLVVGDFDSSPVPSHLSCEVIQLPVRKDDTDTMVCLKEGIRRGFQDFLLLGMTGGRPDHTFANFSALSYLAQRGLRGEIIDREWHYRVLADEEWLVTEHIGCPFAVFPFGCGECHVTLDGFLYEGEDILLQADFPMGVSNTVTASPALVRVRSTALVMLKRC